MNNQLIQNSLFDPLVPYITTIGTNENNEFYVEFMPPDDLIIDTDEMKKYFKDYRIISPKPKILHMGHIRAWGRKEPRTISGTLLDRKIGEYLYVKNVGSL